jgi:hypothetical protein
MIYIEIFTLHYKKALCGLSKAKRVGVDVLVTISVFFHNFANFGANSFAKIFEKNYFFLHGKQYQTSTSPISKYFDIANNLANLFFKTIYKNP